MGSAAEDLLRIYREKRDFTRTREPAGGASSADGLVFVVQKHDATRLHYDFRLEWEGVLKSWAVTKGPSLDPADKRLAVRTEDHPMDYGDFEGTIPEGQYGGGTVMLWDFGRWSPREDMAEGLAKGSIKMDLLGEKMRGHWALVRMKPRGKETRENWLLIKEKDGTASTRRNILRADRSVKTGRTMHQIAKGDETWTRETKRPEAKDEKPQAGKETNKDLGKLPRFRPLQLATLVDEAPAGNEWLEALIGAGAGGEGGLLYSQHVRGSGASVFASICREGHEGIVSKRADAPYREGRGRAWLKTKCTRRQEFVIGGYSPSDKKRRAFSSILVGVMEDGKLLYRGRVGSGFTEASLGDLQAHFKDLARKTSPFEALPREIARGARFVKPELVAEVDFAEFTAEDAVRHGVFKGLREDKEAGEIAGERPKRLKAMGKSATRSKSGAKASGPADVAGVRLTSPDRVVFESQGLTKLDLARYYEAVAPRMLAHLARRPLSLVRCPQGGARQCFFQKHDTGGFPDAVGHVEVKEKDGESARYLSLSDAPGLVAAVQMNTLEFHIWGSRNDRLEHPDRLVFDLDPDEQLAFADVRKAAMDLRDRLAEGGLSTFPLLTGGKGVHLVAPLARRQDWAEVKGFAKAVAQQMEAEEPKRFVATMSKAKRRGRIFIDWLRNERGQTAIAPYSTRSRQGAPVATPVSWDELETLGQANGFHPADILRRLDEPDPWGDYAGTRQSITRRLAARFSGA